MKALAELLVSFIELLEEEGRALREATARLFISIVLFGVAGVLIIAGLLMAGAGVFHVLTPLIGRAWAYFALAAVFLVGAWALFGRGSKLVGRKENGDDAG